MNKLIKLIAIATLFIGSIAQAQSVQTAIGTIVGGAVGNKLCSSNGGNGRTACTVAGALVGGYVGNASGNANNQAAQRERRGSYYQDRPAPQPQQMAYVSRDTRSDNEWVSVPTTPVEPQRVVTRFERRQPAPAMCTEYQRTVSTPRGDIELIGCACQDRNGQFRDAAPQQCQ